LPSQAITIGTKAQSGFNKILKVVSEYSNYFVSYLLNNQYMIYSCQIEVTKRYIHLRRLLPEIGGPYNYNGCQAGLCYFCPILPSQFRQEATSTSLILDDQAEFKYQRQGVNMAECKPSGRKYRRLQQTVQDGSHCLQAHPHADPLSPLFE
jgi:hypothetical protein